MVVAFDTETELIVPGRQAPPLVCASLCDEEHCGLYHHTEAREVFEALLRSNLVIVGHNIAFDMAVCATKWIDLLPEIFQAYRDNRITDTMLREKLIHIGAGISYQYKAKGSYSLEGLARRRLELQMEKGTWQLRYGELMDVPLEEWPEGAKDYAIGDSVVTYEIYWVQERVSTWLEDQYRQARAAWWITLMKNHGIMTDPKFVKVFKSEVQTEHDELFGQLRAAGLLREDGSRDMKAAAEAMEAFGLHRRKKVSSTAMGRVALDKDSCSKMGMNGYVRYSSVTKQISTDIPLVEKGTKIPIHPYFDSLLVTGRTSSSPNVQNLPRKIGMRECFVPRPGYVFANADYSMFELRTVSQVCLHMGFDSKLAAALNAGLDPHLQMAAIMLHISYDKALKRREAGDDEVDRARQSGKVCFHPDTEVLTKRGWVQITELKNSDEVCSAKLQDDGSVDLEWEIPLALTQREFSGNLVHLKSEGIDLRVTPDHRMCGWRRTNGRGVGDHVVTCSSREIGGLRYWPNAGTLSGGREVDERLLRLAVAVQADGHFTEYGPIRLGFTKPREIERLRLLLSEGEYSFKLVGEQQVATFYLSDELWNKVRELLTPEKTLPWWWVELSFEARQAVLDEARYWDSHTYQKAGYGYCSVIESNADVLQAIATLTNTKSRKVHRSTDRQDVYMVSVKTKHRSRGGNLKPVDVPYDGLVYCLTTRNDTIVVRDGGVPVITRQCNFGFPGGLGFASFVEHARTQYNVYVTLKEARELKEFWLAAWPEFHSYFKLVGHFCEVPEPMIKHVFSGRFRGSVTYTEACNTFFQGLAADAAKAAGFLIAEACYVDETSPLFGCHIVNFVHDEFIVEAPEDNAAEAAEELSRLMVVGASPFLPDVPPIAEPLLMRRWSKKAKTIRDENGRLVPWDMSEAEYVELMRKSGT